MTPGIVAESDLSGNLQSEYVFFNGERVARKDFLGGAVSYYFSDNLGTAAVITDSAGNIKEDADYYPSGTALPLINNDPNKYKFNGKEQDSESGLYNYGARYYNPALSRFLTPDWSSTPVPVPYADLSDPQSLNQYAYVRNNPTTNSDPNGHECTTDPKTGNSKCVVRAKADPDPPKMGEAHKIIEQHTMWYYMSHTNTSGTDHNPGAKCDSACFNSWMAFHQITSLAGGIYAATAAAGQAQQPQVGQKVYRVFGGQAGAAGRSWTPVNPETVPNYRDAAGLPNVNTATQIEIGTLTSTDGITVRPAEPLDGNKGGLTEYVIPDPNNQVKVGSVKEFNPNN
jgi:RHS repeat-associated protein